MKIECNASDLAVAQQMITDIARDVADQHQVYGADKGTPVGVDALKSLSETRIRFGDPHNELVHLTRERFAKFGVTLSEVFKTQLQNQFDFYYMTLTVSLQPGRGAQFKRLECGLEFDTSAVNVNPILQSIFPTSEWKDVLNYGGGLSLGLKGDLKWEVGADLSHLPENVQKALPGSVSGSLSNINNMSSFITIPNFDYSLGRAELIATGEGSPEAFWRIDKPDLRQNPTARFGMVFKVKKGARQAVLRGKVAAEADIPFLTALVDDVFSDLKQKWQEFLNKLDDARSPVEKLPIGDIQDWTINLPK